MRYSYVELQGINEPKFLVNAGLLCSKALVIAAVQGHDKMDTYIIASLASM
jgi:hypothetical protein